MKISYIKVTKALAVCVWHTEHKDSVSLRLILFDTLEPGSRTRLLWPTVLQCNVLFVLWSVSGGKMNEVHSIKNRTVGTALHFRLYLVKQNTPLHVIC